MRHARCVIRGAGYRVALGPLVFLGCLTITAGVAAEDSSEAARMHALEKGATAFMRKPAQIDELMALVRRLTGRERAA